MGDGEGRSVTTGRLIAAVLALLVCFMTAETALGQELVTCKATNASGEPCAAPERLVTDGILPSPPTVRPARQWWPGGTTSRGVTVKTSSSAR